MTINHSQGRRATGDDSVAGDFAAFFSLACAISWFIWSPLWLPALGVRGLPVLPYHHAFGAIGPLAAAFAVTAALSGWQGVRDLLGRMVAWRGRARWILVSVAGPFVLLGAALLATWPLGLGEMSLRGVGTSREFPFWPPAVFFLYNVVSFGFGEETGWRGFAVERLQQRYSPVIASLLLTPAWALWHLPLFLYRPGYATMDLAALAGWIASLTTGSILLGWLYNASRRSVLVVALFHASVDVVFTADIASPVVVTATGALITLCGLAVLPWMTRGFDRRSAATR